MQDVANARPAAVGWTERVEFALWLWPLSVASVLVTLLVMEISDRWMPRPHASWEVLPLLVAPSLPVGLVGYLRVQAHAEPAASAHQALGQRPVLLYASVGALVSLVLWMWFVSGAGFVLPFIGWSALTGVGGLLAVLTHTYRTQWRGAAKVTGSPS